VSVDTGGRIRMIGRTEGGWFRMVSDDFG
jgi:hypothetical protein